jgi:hypothetical protein
MRTGTYWIGVEKPAPSAFRISPHAGRKGFFGFSAHIANLFKIEFGERRKTHFIVY